MNPTDAITQAAHDLLARHGAESHLVVCEHPCVERELAERVVQLAADVAAKEDEIRALVEDAATYKAFAGRPLLVSALELLGCRGCDRAESAKRPDGNYTHDIPGCRL